MTQEERQEKSQARAERMKDKADYSTFHRQMLTLKEYLEERKKIPALQKANKAPVKVVAAVDSSADGDNPNKLTGYIRQDVGDNSSNIYEVTFDRKSKTIVSVKRSEEGEGVEKEEKASGSKKKENTKIIKKTKKDDDESDDEDEPEKPSKKKQKDEDAD